MIMPNTKLEAARLQRRWSVEVASSKVGVSTNTFNRWERGLQLPQLETLDLLCTAFDMSPEELGFDHVISAKRRIKGAECQDYQETALSCRVLAQSAAPTLASITTRSPLEDMAFPPPSDQRLAHLDQFSEQLYQNSYSFCPAMAEEGNEEVTRRRAIAFLLHTPAAIFGLTPEVQAPGTRPPFLHPEEILTLNEVNIPLCWQLYMEGGFRELYTILPGYLPVLSELAQQPSPYQQKAASQASQSHQLAYLLALQRQDFGVALKHTHEAARYAQIAGDNNLLVASLIRRAYVYLCMKHTEKRLHAYEEAQLYSYQNCSPLLLGYLYAGLAETHAALQNEHLSRYYMDLAQRVFPAQPENDAQFPYTHFRWPTIHNLRGLALLQLKRFQEAEQAFAGVSQAVPPSIGPYRVEVTVHMAITAFELNELEQSCELLTKASALACTLYSPLRYNDSYELYKRMQGRWQGEARIGTLTDIFYQRPFI